MLNKGSKDVKGATIYVALFPCNECAKIIVQSGIKEVVYLSDVVSQSLTHYLFVSHSLTNHHNCTHKT